MRLKNLMILACLCLLPTACADGQLDNDIPPITEVQPPAVQPAPENPATPQEPGDDNDGNDGGPHLAPVGDIQVQKMPTWEIVPQGNQYPQAAPCVIHPEDC